MDNDPDYGRSFIERHQGVWIDRQVGMTYRALGDKYGLSPSRIQQVLEKRERLVKRYLVQEQFAALPQSRNQVLRLSAAINTLNRKVG